MKICMRKQTSFLFQGTIWFFAILFSLFTTIQSACLAPWTEQNGLVLIEAENLTPLPSAWQEQTTVAGFTGTSYIFYHGSTYSSSPGNHTVTGKFSITTPGVYRFNWRNAIGEGTSKTEANDSWVRFPDLIMFASKGDTAYANGGY